MLFFTFPVLVWLVDGAAAGRLGGLPSAFVAGWWFGFGYFFAGLYWMGHAFLVDAKTFGWMLPFAVTAVPAGLALFTGFGLAFARAIWTRGPVRILSLAIALTVAEWLRGHLFTGFPWNTYGYALTGPLALAQTAALIGIWGLTFIAVAVFATPALFADDRADTRRPWLPLLAGVVLLCALAGYGAMAPGADADAARQRRAAADHAAQPAAGREVQLRRPARGDEALHRAVRSLDRTAVDRRARRHAFDLAGIGVPVFPDARGRGAFADRRAACRRAPC